MGCGINKSRHHYVHKNSTKIKQVEDHRQVPPNFESEGDPKISQNQLVLRRISKITNNYTLGVKIGGGSYGDVRVANHLLTGQKRVIKSIKKIKIHSEQEQIKFTNEVEILQTLDHPNIIKLFEFYDDDNNFYLVTEYLAGGELFDYMARKQYLTEPIAAHFLKQILSALAYIHSKGIIHGDLKPQNLVLDKESDDAIVKIIDFNTSIRINSAQPHLLDTSLMYTSPEILKNSKFDEKSDMWSLGVILFIFLSGTEPFNGDSEEEIRDLIFSGNYKFNGPHWDNISNECIKLIKDLMNPSPSKRISASKALKNPWIKKFANRRTSLELNSLSLSHLRSFVTGQKIQYVFLSFIANHLLSNDESTQLYQRFKSLDKNCDGKLNQDELVDAYSSIMKKQEAVDEARNIMKMVDVDNSGFIDYAEFLTACARRKTLLCRKNLENAFKAFDIDENGTISKEEILQILGKMGPDDETVNKLIEHMDTNNDGLIDLNEFKRAMNKCFNSKSPS